MRALDGIEPLSSVSGIFMMILQWPACLEKRLSAHGEKCREARADQNKLLVGLKTNVRLQKEQPFRSGVGLRL
jgi:hypothetical protein